MFLLPDPDTNLEASEPQGPNVWEPPSPRGTQAGEASAKRLPRLCRGVSTGPGLTRLEVKGGEAKHGHLAGACAVISGKLWPEMFHVRTDIMYS